MTKGDPCQQTTQIYAQLWRWFLMPQTTVTHKTGLSIWWFQKISITYELLTSCLHEMVLCYQNCSDLWSSYVLWQVSFGFWVTWSISSWKENYKSVFFPKLQFLNDKLQLSIPKKGIWHFGKIFLVNLSLKSF